VVLYVFDRRLLDFLRSECSYSGVIEESSLPEYDSLLIGYVTDEPASPTFRVSAAQYATD